MKWSSAELYKHKSWLGYGLFLFLFLMIIPAYSVVVLYEGFEGYFPDDNRWTVNDANASGTPAMWDDVNAAFGAVSSHSGYSKGYCAGVNPQGNPPTAPQYRDYMDAFMSRDVDLTGFSVATLTFWYNIPSIENNYDYGEFMINTTRLLKRGLATNGWVKYEVPLDSYCGQSITIKFNFHSDYSQSSEGMYLDDILIEAFTTRIPGAEVFGVNVDTNSVMTSGVVNFTFGYNVWNSISNSTALNEIVVGYVDTTGNWAGGGVASTFPIVAKTYPDFTTGYAGSQISVPGIAGNYPLRWNHYQLGSASQAIAAFKANPRVFVSSGTMATTMVTYPNNFGAIVWNPILTPSTINAATTINVKFNYAWWNDAKYPSNTSVMVVGFTNAAGLWYGGSVVKAAGAKIITAYPGTESGVANFNITTPSTTGQYYLRWGMIQNITSDSAINLFYNSATSYKVTGIITTTNVVWAFPAKGKIAGSTWVNTTTLCQSSSLNYSFWWWWYNNPQTTTAQYALVAGITDQYGTYVGPTAYCKWGPTIPTAYPDTTVFGVDGGSISMPNTPGTYKIKIGMVYAANTEDAVRAFIANDTIRMIAFDYVTTIRVLNCSFRNVQNFSIIEGNTTANLTWLNPTISYAGTYVAGRADRFPSGPTDGIRKYWYNGQVYNESGLPSGVPYYYGVFAHDSSIKFATGMLGAVIPGSFKQVANLYSVVSGTQVSFTWKNPAVADYLATMIIRRTDRYPTGPNDGVIRYWGPGVNYIDTGLSSGSTYYYTIYAHDKNYNYSPGDVIPVTVGGNNYLVQNLSTRAGNKQAAISWTNPIFNNYKAALIVRRTDRYSNSPFDGDVRFWWSGSGFVDTGLLSATKYYYTFFMQDSSDTFYPAGAVTIIPNSFKNIRKFTDSPSVGSVQLTWDNPTAMDYRGTMIVRRTDRYPTGPTDGNIVYWYNSGIFVDGDVNSSITYYYGVFAHDSDFNFSPGMWVASSPNPYVAGSVVASKTLSKAEADKRANWESQLNDLMPGYQFNQALNRMGDFDAAVDLNFWAFESMGAVKTLPDVKWFAASEGASGVVQVKPASGSIGAKATCKTAMDINPKNGWYKVNIIAKSAGAVTPILMVTRSFGSYQSIDALAPVKTTVEDQSGWKKMIAWFNVDAKEARLQVQVKDETLIDSIEIQNVSPTQQAQRQFDNHRVATLPISAEGHIIDSGWLKMTE